MELPRRPGDSARPDVLAGAVPHQPGCGFRRDAGRRGDRGGAGRRSALVGIVSRVGRRNAEVDTLFASSLRLSAAFENGSTGFLNTGERQPVAGKLPVGHLPVNVKFTPGETALTTGYEAGIPRGILIGRLSTVDEVDPDFSSAQHISGLLTPHADFDNLRFVTVAIPTGAPPEENRP